MPTKNKCAFVDCTFVVGKSRNYPRTCKNGSKYCHEHQPHDVYKQGCQYVITRGFEKHNHCESTCKQGTNFCSVHQRQEYESESESEEQYSLIAKPKTLSKAGNVEPEALETKTNDKWCKRCKQVFLPSGSDLCSKCRFTCPKPGCKETVAYVGDFCSKHSLADVVNVTSKIAIPLAANKTTKLVQNQKKTLSQAGDVEPDPLQSVNPTNTSRSITQRAEHVANGLNIAYCDGVPFITFCSWCNVKTVDGKHYLTPEHAIAVQKSDLSQSSRSNIPEQKFLPSVDSSLSNSRPPISFGWLHSVPKCTASSSNSIKPTKTPKKTLSQAGDVELVESNVLAERTGGEEKVDTETTASPVQVQHIPVCFEPFDLILPNQLFDSFSTSFSTSLAKETRELRSYIRKMKQDLEKLEKVDPFDIFLF